MIKRSLLVAALATAFAAPAAAQTEAMIGSLAAGGVVATVLPILVLGIVAVDASNGT